MSWYQCFYLLETLLENFIKNVESVARSLNNVLTPEVVISIMFCQ